MHIRFFSTVHYYMTNICITICLEINSPYTGSGSCSLQDLVTTCGGSITGCCTISASQCSSSGNFCSTTSSILGNSTFFLIGDLVGDFTGDLAVGFPGDFGVLTEFFSFLKRMKQNFNVYSFFFFDQEQEMSQYTNNNMPCIIHFLQNQELHVYDPFSITLKDKDMSLIPHHVSIHIHSFISESFINIFILCFTSLNLLILSILPFLEILCHRTIIPQTGTFNTVCTGKQLSKQLKLIL